jgi:hypothetical protein
MAGSSKNCYRNLPYRWPRSFGSIATEDQQVENSVSSLLGLYGSECLQFADIGPSRADRDGHAATVEVESPPCSAVA